MRPTAADLAHSLKLTAHPEGGYFLETFRSTETIPTPRGDRPVSTAILFLVTASSVSHLHRLAGDELWVFQGGLPLELVKIAPDGELSVCMLGGVQDGDPGGLELVPQALVPAGSWQGARLAGGPHLPASRAWALVSCVVSPGFDYADFELGDREELLAAFPRYRELILALT